MQSITPTFLYTLFGSTTVASVILAQSHGFTFITETLINMRIIKKKLKNMNKSKKNYEGKVFQTDLKINCVSSI